MISANDLAKAMEGVDRYALTLDDESARYWRLHRTRFAWVADLTRKLVAKESSRPDQPFRILDVGNSFQTLLFAKALPSARVDTLGFFDHRFPAGADSGHYEMDLNDSYFPERWPVPREGTYDLVAFMEVIEHLYTSPLQVLSCLKSLLRPGGLLLVQTPNAAALKKRLKLLNGRNPYERIRVDRANPGHFREYTVSDLEYYAKQSGFQVESVHMDSFLVDGKRFDRICDRLSRYLPGPLKCGVTAVLRSA